MKTIGLSVAVGFLICLALFPPWHRETRTEFVSVPFPYPDTTIKRVWSEIRNKITEFLDDHRYPVIDTVWRDSIVYVPVDSATAIGSIPVRKETVRDSLVRKGYRQYFDLSMIYRGIFYSYEITFFPPVIELPEQRAPFLKVYGSLGFTINQHKILTAEFEGGFKFKEHYIIFGRAEADRDLNTEVKAGGKVEF